MYACALLDDEFELKNLKARNQKNCASMRVSTVHTLLQHAYNYQEIIRDFEMIFLRYTVCVLLLYYQNEKIRRYALVILK